VRGAGGKLKQVFRVRGTPWTLDVAVKSHLEVDSSMRTVARSRLALLLIGLLAFAVPALRAKDAPTSAKIDPLLPKDTSIVIVVDVKQIVESPVFKKNLLEDAKKHLQSNEEVSKTLSLLGFDPFKDLDRITLAVEGIAMEPKGLVVVRGKFDKEKIEAKAETEAKEHKDFLKIHSEDGHKIYEVTPPGQEKPAFVAVIDGTAIVASSDKSIIKDAFAKATSTAPSIKPELAKLIEGAEGSLWIAVPGSALSKSELVNEEKAKAMVGKIDHILASLKLAKDLKLSVTIATKSDDNAKEMAEEIKEGLNQAKGMVAFMASQQKEAASAVDMMNAMKVTVEGKNITIKTEMTEEMIDKAHAARKGQQ
jgi:hypothetical protein